MNLGINASCERIGKSKRPKACDITLACASVMSNNEWGERRPGIRQTSNETKTTKNETMKKRNENERTLQFDRPLTILSTCSE